MYKDPDGKMNKNFEYHKEEGHGHFMSFNGFAKVGEWLGKIVHGKHKTKLTGMPKIT